MIETVIFDLDGTLTDSFDGITDAFNHALEVHGFPPCERDMVRRLIGTPLERMLEILVPEMDDVTNGKVSATYREYYITICGQTSPLLPKVREALAHLSGRRLVCASTKYTEQIETVLKTQGIMEMFCLLLGSEGIPKKPAPDLFLLAMERTGSAPEGTAAVGDMIFDVGAARAAGCLPVGVLTGMGTERELREAGCRHVFPDLLEAAWFITSVE